MCFLEAFSLLPDLLLSIIYQTVQNRIPYRRVSIAMFLSLMGIFFIVSEVCYLKFLILKVVLEQNIQNKYFSYPIVNYCLENFILTS